MLKGIECSPSCPQDCRYLDEGWSVVVPKEIIERALSVPRSMREVIPSSPNSNSLALDQSFLAILNN